jgi:hypothetical protein
MSRRSALLALAAALAVAGCARDDLGRRVPSCDPNEASATLLLSAQSVPDAEFIPCVNDLRVGWEYEHLEAERGRSRFWLSSDRVGERFLEVTVTGSCDLGDALQVRSDEADAPLLVDVRRSDAVLSVVVVPEGAEGLNRGYALRLADELSVETVANRTVRVTVDAGDDPTEDRISRALERGSPVFAVGVREREENTIELHLPNRRATPERLPLSEALQRIESGLGDPVYQATWHYLVRSACITYEFDARGPGVDTLPEQVQEALGLYPLDPLREYGRQLGYRIP